jgi:hypothetical protein
MVPYLMLTYLAAEAWPAGLTKSPIKAYPNSILDFGGSRFDNLFGKQIQGSKLIIIPPQTPC